MIKRVKVSLLEKAGNRSGMRIFCGLVFVSFSIFMPMSGNNDTHNMTANIFIHLYVKALWRYTPWHYTFKFGK